MVTAVSPATATGVVRLPPVTPIPSCPIWLLPQVRTVPSARSATPCSRPVCTSTTSVGPAHGAAAVRAVVVPLPSSPNALPPHEDGVPGGAAASAGAGAVTRTAAVRAATSPPTLAVRRRWVLVLVRSSAVTSRG